MPTIRRACQAAGRRDDRERWQNTRTTVLSGVAEPCLMEYGSDSVWQDKEYPKGVRGPGSAAVKGAGWQWCAAWRTGVAGRQHWAWGRTYFGPRQRERGSRPLVIWRGARRWKTRAVVEFEISRTKILVLHVPRARGAVARAACATASTPSEKGNAPCHAERIWKTISL
jgi:hypothetical protein